MLQEITSFPIRREQRLDRSPQPQILAAGFAEEVVSLFRRTPEGLLEKLGHALPSFFPHPMALPIEGDPSSWLTYPVLPLREKRT